VNRGEVWLAKVLPPPTTSRAPQTPHYVLLLSWDAEYRTRDRVTVAPISTKIRRLDAEVFLDHTDGMPQGCAINLDIIATILRATLTTRVTRLSDGKMRDVERAIHLALGMPLPCDVRYGAYPLA